MPIPSQHEYERREVALAHEQLEHINDAPLDDRRAAAREFFEIMRDAPHLVGERIGWLLGGNYGFGAKVLATRILHRPRMNREAALTQMIGAFEWQSPEAMTRQAWKRLTGSEKAALADEVADAILTAEQAERTGF